MNILNEIAEKTRERIEKDKKEMPREDLIREIQQKKVQMLLNPLIQSETAKTPHSFYQALKKPGMSYICEVKSHRIFRIWTSQKSIKQSVHPRFPA